MGGDSGSPGATLAECSRWAAGALGCRSSWRGGRGCGLGTEGRPPLWEGTRGQAQEGLAIVGTSKGDRHRCPPCVPQLPSPWALGTWLAGARRMRSTSCTSPWELDPPWSKPSAHPGPDEETEAQSEAGEGPHGTQGSCAHPGHLCPRQLQITPHIARPGPEPEAPGDCHPP